MKNVICVSNTVPSIYKVPDELYNRIMSLYSDFKGNVFQKLYDDTCDYPRRKEAELLLREIHNCESLVCSGNFIEY